MQNKEKESYKPKEIKIPKITKNFNTLKRCVVNNI